ncbi:hypothetical protein HUK80_00055 [Flavobacterium sp. MAH-1]|uniref:Uncharacterized protein n=1 Tax=Flavobacterium agri TaxID=2743471 RepID=A0A7Y8XYV8_9FLAO|nr:hypothetical protein [Flavobacterium agri]NUY79268.1 hypothetical protein [Flavobacterium agri]NYA69292.1 hypothetical protein [Flavobacterium agri]
MFEKYTYKQKLLALMAIFVLMAATAYKRSYRNLFELYFQNAELKAKAVDIKKKSAEFARIRKDKQTFDALLGSEKGSKELVQQNIMAFTSRRGGVSIQELAPIHSFSTEDYQANTNQLDVTGSLDGMLRLAYGFETDFRDSRLFALHFYKTKFNMRETLHLKLFFQNYESNK